MLFKEKITEKDKRISNLYINEIKNAKILDENKQKELILAWKNHKDINARNQLIESNLRLVVKRALAYFKNTFLPLVTLKFEFL